MNSIRREIFYAICSLMAGPLFATDYTWNVTSGNWDSNSSWLPNTAFPNGSGDNAIFSNTTPATVAIDGSFEVGQITCNAGKSITLNVSSGALTIDTGVTIAASGQIIAGASNVIATSPHVTVNGTFTCNGFNNTFGPLTGGGSVVLSAGETLTLSGSETFAGVIQGGNGSGGVTWKWE